MHLNNLLCPFRLVTKFQKASFVKQSLRSVYIYEIKNIGRFYNNSLNFNSRAMSQKSITSFFKITPKKPTEDSKATSKETGEDESLDDIPQGTPIKNGSAKRSSKRQRISSSSSEAESPKKATSPPESAEKKNKVKRQRIESSGSEAEVTVETKEEVKVEKSDSPASKIQQNNKKSKSKKVASETVKKTSPKIKKETKTPNKTNIKEEKSPLREKNIKDSEKSNKNINPVTKKDVSKDIKQDNKEINGDAKEVTVADVDYNPAKPKYHPIKDACWSKGQEVPYLALAKTLEAIEGTSARLKIVDILSNYFRSVIALTPEDLLPSVYLCLNQLAPAYHSLELGIAETYLMKAIGQSTGRSLAQIKAMMSKEGDLGSVGQQCRATQRMMFAPAPLAARRVLAALRDVARMAGQASVNKKIGKIQALYVACRHCEAKFLIRSLEGKLRVGLAEQSVLQALAAAAAATPPGPAGVAELDASRGLNPEEFKARVERNALIIKTTYCECPNYERLIPVLLRHGVEALPAHCRLTPGVPLKPMLAHPTKGVHEIFNRFENEEFTCEWKYDGERAQIHVPAAGGAGGGGGGGGGAALAAGGGGGPDLAAAAIFSRNQENNTSKYPDVLARLPALLAPSVRSCVLDCEAVAYDVQAKQILPFQVLSTRKRKEAAEADIKVQVCVFVFDLLYLNGSPLVRRALAERRALLRQHFREQEGQWQFATHKDCASLEEVQQFLDAAVRGSCEGLMVKMLRGENARYDIARRSHNWLKLKKDYLEGVGDTIDAVVIGGYRGRGRRAGALGGFLLACWDAQAETFQALCKVGTGFSDQDLAAFSRDLEEHTIAAPKTYYRFDGSAPDVWFAPAAVWEVRCADLSLSAAYCAARGLVSADKGVSLRFPRFVRVRPDKTPEQATSAAQLAALYRSQDQVRAAPPAPPEDGFY